MSEDYDIPTIAGVAYEAMRAYRAALNPRDTRVEWYRASDGVREQYCAAVALYIKEPGRDPSYQHEMWMQNKLEDGWEWGPEESEHFKQHPCLRPYEDLPVAEKRKDVLFQAIVRALTSAA